MILQDDTSDIKAGCVPAFPIGVTCTADGKKTVTCAPECLEAAKKLDAMEPDAIFRQETGEMLLSALEPLLAEYGYTGEIAISTEYRLNDRNGVNRALILPSSEPLLPMHGYRNLTECEPDPLNDGLLCFGTVIDGEILSAASENPHDPEGKFIDIGTETAKGYENRGYAASNVAALAYYLLDPGITVTYIAEDSNAPSRRVAEKVGFSPDTRELRIVCYKEE